MIKTFEQFNSGKTYGEIVEELYHKDEYIRDVVNRFIGDVESTIRIANAVNLLDRKDSIELKHEIDRYQRDGLSTEIKTYVTGDISEEIELESAGRNVFRSFLKSLSALGIGALNQYDNTPEDFLFYYQADGLFIDDVMMIFNRFRSLIKYITFLEHSENRINLYFGINTQGEFEYGVKSNKRHIIGKFKLNKSAKNWMLKIDNKIINTLKKDLVNISERDIKTMSIIKNDLQNFFIESYKQKSKVDIKDNIISIGFYGIGRWDNGILNNDDFIQYKTIFNNWVLKKRWGNNVVTKITTESFWVYFSIKIK